MRTRIIIGGVLVSIGILSAGVESTIVQQQALTAAGGTSTSDAGTSDAGTSGSAGTSSGGTATTPSTGTGSGSTSTSLKDGTYTGTTAVTRFGNVQVQVTIAGGKITDVTALQLTDQDGRSVQISAQAAPLLQQEALTAQSATIDTVSGATYTSEGYIQSLQSALDQAQ
ncbi:FMN-binding protein [Curtobacterium sp. MCPF17_002]|uniref:FMN-binding protein n=1 Tax=Curtobacterium sp. MCPF17_002 TaxID=2175645 RepID=UPI0021AD2A40|nr:FMN-binding protein [Curtobacterium sp. MCPF17_002]WIB79007.1 FMN-binding protein [Curtobacterium sp. MCPF17_002]